MEAAGIEISPATIRTRSQVSLGPRFRLLRLSRPAPDAQQVSSVAPSSEPDQPGLMITSAIPEVEFARLEETWMDWVDGWVTVVVGGENCSMYEPPPIVPMIGPSEPQAPPQSETLPVNASDGWSCVTEILRGTGEPWAGAVNEAGEMLTTGPGAPVIVKVSESETPEPFAAVAVTVTELGTGGVGGAI